MHDPRPETFKPDPEFLAQQQRDQQEVENRWPDGIRWRCWLPPHHPSARQEWPVLIIKADAPEIAKARYIEYYELPRDPPQGISAVRADDPS
jgi:hypothetical protein